MGSNSKRRMHPRPTLVPEPNPLIGCGGEGGMGGERKREGMNGTHPILHPLQVIPRCTYPSFLACPSAIE
jgi:hypothetical protein